MLKADIPLSDLTQEVKLEGGVIRAGNGRITPYPHAALETLLIRTELQWFVCVRERRAEATTKARFTEATVTPEEFARLHRESLLWPLDYVMMEVAQAGCRIKLRAGVCGVAPVYCRASHDRLEISWDFSDLMRRDLFVDGEVASHYLALSPVYASRQIFSGITMLTERASFFMAPGQALYQYPPVAPPTIGEEETDEEKAVDRFGELLRDVIAKRPLLSDRSGVQLSGGMDSAAVAMAVTELAGPIHSRGILIGDTNRDAQIQRRRRIIEHLHLSDGTVDILAFPPSLDLTPSPDHGRAPHNEYYLEAFEALWSNLYEQGCEWLFTGIGGDELFLPYSDEEKPGNRNTARLTGMRRTAESLLTPRARQAAATLRSFDAPRAPVPISALLGQACQAPNFLRHGLWPVSPLSHPTLVAYCHGLPRSQRHHRSIMRRYLNRGLGHEVFAVGYAKETFVRVLPDLIAESAATIAAQLRECALADLGLVDRDAALRLLAEVASTRSDVLTSPLASFLWLERLVRRVV